MPWLKVTIVTIDEHVDCNTNRYLSLNFKANDSSPCHFLCSKSITCTFGLFSCFQFRNFLQQAYPCVDLAKSSHVGLVVSALDIQPQQERGRVRLQLSRTGGRQWLDLRGFGKKLRVQCSINVQGMQYPPQHMYTK